MCNVVTIILVLTKIFILLIYYDELHDVIHYAKRNFWHMDYDSYEQIIMNKCKRTCTIFVCIFTFFAEGTVTTYIVRPLMGKIFKHKVIITRWNNIFLRPFFVHFNNTSFWHDTLTMEYVKYTSLYVNQAINFWNCFIDITIVAYKRRPAVFHKNNGLVFQKNHA